MKSKEFEAILKEKGFELVRINGHRIWSNGTRQVAVPHGKEINKMMARRLLKEIGYDKRVPQLNFG